MFHTRHFPGVVDAGPPPDGDTIGSGGDFATLDAWWADIPSTLTEPRVGILLDGTHEVSGANGFHMTGKTTTAINNITLKAQNNHGGSFTGGGGATVRNPDAGGAVIRLECSNVALQDFRLLNDVAVGDMAYASRIDTLDYTGNVFDRLLAYRPAAETGGIGIAFGFLNSGVGVDSVIINSCGILNYSRAALGFTGARGAMRFNHCTFYGANADSNPVWVRCAIYGCATYNYSDGAWSQMGAVVDSAFETNTGEFPNRVPANELVNPSNDPALADFRLPAGTTTLRDVIASNHGASTDFLGTSRPQGASFDCGCHELI